MSTSATPGLELLQPTMHGRWEPRRALTLSAARRRTAFVRLLRFIFLTAIAAIIALLAVQLFLGAAGGAPAPSEAVSTDVRMVNPRITGRDEHLTPYALTADVAVRRRDDSSGLTELERPRLDYDFLNTGTNASEVLAQTGTFDPATRILDLFSDVNLNTDNGYSFSSQHARIFLREERVSGESPVTGSGPVGTISADRYEIHEGGNRVIFEGNVHARIVQDRTAPSDGEDQ
ncbi:LPS export ABC transporter periplasmic protein LptC [uncultured Maricaulis sp.]|uniref:LPS export ABC transporter periplasmic protein LptC n=1 Tax=uncultured Maricaulis sp. TaxID=174710 RepID=UPI0030D928F9